MQASGLPDSGVFFPMPPKIMGSRPKILFLAMEPSGSWATSNDDALKQIEFGKRCYWCHLGDFTLQFSIREALTEVLGVTYSNEYYITNMGKCALIVANAKKSQSYRWSNCFSVLKSELEHVYRESYATDPPVVISIGEGPRTYLNKHPLYIDTSSGITEIKVHGSILHYSKNWLRKRIDNYLIDNPSLAMRCNDELSAIRSQLVSFIRTVSGPQVHGTEKVKNELRSDYLLSLYARLSCVYKHMLIRCLKDHSRRIG
jgi:hypothetical protein